MGRTETAVEPRLPTVGVRTWRRRALELLPRLGLRVVDVWPGVVVVSRREHLQALDALPDDAVLLSRGDPPALRPLGPGGALVTSTRLDEERYLRLERDLHRYLVPEHVARLCRRYRVDCVLDVGANRGQYGEQLRAAGYRGEIVSFEPVADTFAKLRKTAERDGSWAAHQLALGRADGETDMHVVPGTMSSMLPPSRYGRGRYEELREVSVEAVRVRRLDGLFEGLLAHLEGKRLFLKLDTQGYDLEAFAGLGDRVGQVVALQSEVALLQIYDGMPRLQEQLTTYEAAGFGVTGFYPVTRQSRTWRVLEFDCVMVRPRAA